MRLNSAHICPICGKGKGGNIHKQCSATLQKQHLAKKRKVPKHLNEKHFDFLTKLDK